MLHDSEGQYLPRQWKFRLPLGQVGACFFFNVCDSFTHIDLQIPTKMKHFTTRSRTAVKQVPLPGWLTWRGFT